MAVRAGCHQRQGCPVPSPSRECHFVTSCASLLSSCRYQKIKNLEFAAVKSQQLYTQLLQFVAIILCIFLKYFDIIIAFSAIVVLKSVLHKVSEVLLPAKMQNVDNTVLATGLFLVNLVFAFFLQPTALSLQKPEHKWWHWGGAN